MMRRKKIWAVGWIVAFAVAAAAGCAAAGNKSEDRHAVTQETEENTAGDGTVSGEPAAEPEHKEPAVSTVRVTAVEGTMITAEPGMLSAGDGAGFTGSGGSMRFEVTDDTAITVEYPRGSAEGNLGDLVLGSVLKVTAAADGTAEAVTVKYLDDGQNFGGNVPVNGTAAVTLDTDGEIEGQTYTCDGDDENALRADGASVSLLNITVNKTGGASSDAAAGELYGQNAGFLALNGAQVTLANAVIDTDAANGTGVFGYGDGTAVAIADSTIRTAGEDSGGIQAADAAAVTAVNLDVETQGSASAAIRGSGGTIRAEGGSFVTNGDGSPAVRCAADISVSGAVLRADAGAGALIEGNGSLALTDCDVTGNMNRADGEDFDGKLGCILICGSRYGDTNPGTAVFAAEGGSITSQSGDMFYVRDTGCEIYLKDVDVTLINDIFLRIEGSDFGRDRGSADTGGQSVTLTAEAQELSGNIFVDEMSGLALTMKDGTVYNGAINPGRAGGRVHVIMDKTSVWTLTADTYINGFEGDMGDVNANGYHLYVGGEEVL